MSDLMRGVLHDPAFQGIEATWRAIQWLVSSLDLGETIELHLFHVTREELSQSIGLRYNLHQRLTTGERDCQR